MPEAIAIDDTYVIFDLAGASYGIPSAAILQMEMVERVAPVPNAPEYVEGIVFSRGVMLPAIDLRTRFGFPRRPFDLRTRLIVVKVGARTVGLIVDSAREFMRLTPDQILPPPDNVSGLSGKYLKGIGKRDERLVLILDLVELIESVEPIEMGDESRDGGIDGIL
jgi:purine-binding chemotaxis protein CheW